ncbi:3-oxoacyl-ACP synthase III family protein [Rhodococcus sp. I2R]|uniref:3-oxoacyl-ACP synthase III family protein n=1 Tax=Rhodococcus sp. I2R TaxID=2855445 RepID=UPI001E527516|nr:3-oxoacyl-ACP synthase III family protein [Rhodococcus sp. I2R]MCC8930176.1 3-oxoacyl-ACP synthase III family protein [Rhodococcus sp. I2R]
MYVLATGTCLPGNAVDNSALAARFGMNAEWIELFVGTRTRYFGVDLESGERTHSIVDLGTHAARQALDRAGLEPSDVDFLVLATATPDTLMPTSATGVADRLGMNLIPAYQLQSGCSGAISALDVARRMLDDENRIGLVIGADLCAKHMVLDRDISSMHPSKLVNYMLFGDGAGAMVISADPDGAIMRANTIHCVFSGAGSVPGQTIEWFGDADRDSEVPAVQEDYKAIERRVPGMSVETARELLRRSSWTTDDVGYLLPPQLSGIMTARIRKEMGMDGAREVSCVAETGNSGNALAFLQFDLLAEVIGPGERALAVAIESSRWIRGGITLEGL